MADVVLGAHGVQFSYDGARTVLDGVDLAVRPGELVTLLGPNGAGKSTLLGCLVGQLTPQRGRVELEGRPVAGMPAREVARLVAYVPQVSEVAYDYEVRAYVAMGRAPHLGLLERPGEDDYQIVDRALDEMGVGHLAHRSFLELSGGERQLVSICRAVAQQPRAIVFDEPMSALDCGNQARVLRLVTQLARDGYAVVMTTHNPDHPLIVGGTVAILDRQGHVTCGDVQAVMDTARLSEVFGTDLRVFLHQDLGRKACILGRI